jgi:hypothetical protein
MSSDTQVEMDLLGGASGQGGAAAPPANGASAGAGSYPSDEEILGIEPVGVKTSTGRDAPADPSKRDSSARGVPQNDNGFGSGNDNAQGGAAGQSVVAAMPQWMQAVAGDPKHGAEAQQLWREHQAFRAAFGSPDEARAIKEIFPGGAQEARTLKQASQAVEQLDAAIYSGDARAQSEVVAELARANPAAFRQLFAEAARVLAGMGQGHAQRDSSVQTAALGMTTQLSSQTARNDPSSPNDGYGGQANNGAQTEVCATKTPTQTPQFDPAAYAAFERSTNDVVARDVRAAVSDTLARVLPEGVAEGAAHRIGEDIFNEIHRTLAADRTLSEQVGDVLRGRRFGTGEQQRVAAIVAGRAKQLVPGVARRVIGEWTSSVLGTARNKAARQAAASARVDIAAPGGSLDSMPLRPMSSREVDYASMSDDQILGM